MIETTTKVIPKSTAIGPEAVPVTWIAAMLKSQYFAGLTMLRDAIEACPDDLWSRSSDKNQTWQIAYHVLYFVHLYLQPTLESFTPWTGQHPEAQNDDAIAAPPDPESTLPLIPEPYTKPEVLAYLEFCWNIIETSLDNLDLTSSTSGFHWYKMPKLEHQFLNLRHLQHHTAQLLERLRSTSDIGIRWRGSVHSG